MTRTEIRVTGFGGQGVVLSGYIIGRAWAVHVGNHAPMIHEKDLVHPTPIKGQPTFGVPSTRIAEALGRSIVQNIVTVGFFAAVAKVVPIEAMREAVKSSVPAGTEELNLQAFDKGVEYAKEAALSPDLQELKS